mmetsp:Transcript_495/g.1075  ORF Transcript_495/g.1075 Transcript_495/m.1075 type:complete len:205 (-) Transcript_495:34-648(-)
MSRKEKEKEKKRKAQEEKEAEEEVPMDLEGIPFDDPFKPGSNHPYTDVPPRGLKEGKLFVRETNVGTGSMPALEGMRVWLALGARGMGIDGEEGVGTISAASSTVADGECEVTWDKSGLVHRYFAGRYGQYQLSLFYYLERKEWMLNKVESEFRKHQKGAPPRVEKSREMECILGFRIDDQFSSRVAYGTKHRPRTMSNMCSVS